MNGSICCRFIVASTLAVIISGCQSASYYGQAVWGHARIMLATRPIDELIRDPDTAPALRQQLTYVLALRDFARTELRLPVGGAYLGYADLHRPYVVWNVFAAPEFSLEPKTWCYPIAGCASYRGYFDREEAERYAEALRRDGYDVFVAGVLAYSTLGWFDEPVLSTFLQLDDARLSALIFHELAHRVLYVPGDTAFNESFATAVEEEGIRRWAAAGRTPGLLAEHERRQKLRDGFIAMVSRRKNELSAIYAGDLPPARKRIEKAAWFSALRNDFESEKQRTPEMAAYEQWFASGLNNAGLATIAAYHDLVPAFQRILGRSGGDLAVFYEECRSLSRLSPPERRQHLQRLMSTRPLQDSGN
jgi:predicted aminopeptidase